MTNLSRQLCEICGLKYCKEKVVINNGQTPNVDIKPFYLDFEQPENFVKLGELKLNYENYTTIFYLVNYLSDNSWCTKKEFLKYLLSILSNTNTYEFYIQLQEKTKQAIRKEEWIYV